MKFEWDEVKNRENIKKHGVPFEEAQTIFFNDFIEKPDINHSENEERFIAIGISYYTRELMVSYCYRFKLDGEEVIRIISSRKATDNERREYYERRIWFFRWCNKKLFE